MTTKYLISSITIIIILSTTIIPVTAQPICESDCYVIESSWREICDLSNCGGCPYCPITLYRCPHPSDPPVHLPSDTTIRILNTRQHGELCTLTRKSIIYSKNHPRDILAPIGRSYNGYNWETVAGRFVRNVNFNCDENGEDYCKVTIPRKKPNATRVFQLIGYDIAGQQRQRRREFSTTTMEDEDEEVNAIARFLDQATFGSTRNDINNMKNLLERRRRLSELQQLTNDINLDDIFAEWIANQTTISTTPITSHREYFRKRINTRIFKSIDMGHSSHPCDTRTSSVWSRFSFFENDWKKLLTIEVTWNTGRRRYRLLVNGKVRTEVTSNVVKLKEKNKNKKWRREKTRQLRPGQSYEICKVKEELNGKFLVRIKTGECWMLLGGNPPVSLSATLTDNPLAVKVLSLPPSYSQTTRAKPKKNKKNNKKRDNAALSLITINDKLYNDTLCSNITLDEWPIFGFIDPNEWVLHVPRLLLLENTLSHPISHFNDSRRKPTNPNVPRTFLNSHSCRPILHQSNESYPVTCGSPGEVSNTPPHASAYHISVGGGRYENEASPWKLTQERSSVWTMIAIYEKDQLRQKMAWALSQIFAVNPKDFVGHKWSVEPFLNYFDIFVRNGLGNFRDVLKEVCYSPIMGEFLGHINSHSTSYHLSKQSQNLVFADENFAREVMQLFTIGNVQLSLSGQPLIQKGKPIPAFDNDDIMSYARAWTGFGWAERRGNIEDHRNTNKVDLMEIVPEKRDFFPKSDLTEKKKGGGYLGDGYPLCEDLDRKVFLKRGARYRYLGSRGYPELHETIGVNETDKELEMVLRLDRIVSDLYEELCRPSSRGGDDCHYESEVTLDRNLDCATDECAMEAVPRVVQVTEDVFYEYVQLPCVELSFYNEGQIIQMSDSTATDEEGVVDGTSMCANPQLPMLTPHHNLTTIPCRLYIKTHNDNEVTIIHSSEYIKDEHMIRHLQQHSPNTFRVHWTDDNYPSRTSNRCGHGLCEILDENEVGDCLCPIHVVEDVIWSRLEDIPLNRNEFLSQVHIGSVSPDISDREYRYTGLLQLDDVSIIIHVDVISQVLDQHTIFEVDIYDRKLYYLNKKSTVLIQTPTLPTSYSFRNPPHFMNFLLPHKRSAIHETDAVLDSYFYHDNTAPFIAIRIIQRFGISNPSPRYVTIVALAFRRGVYEWDGGRVYGSGRYGDLTAMIAALLLDQESRSLILDSDPSFGSVKEPFLKLVSFLRAMEFQPPREQNPNLMFQRDARSRIGQMPYEIPSVFSFFLPEYSPPTGSMATMKLVSPEMMIHITPYIIGLLNGMFSTIKYGWGECHGGFGGEIVKSRDLKFVVKKLERQCRMAREGQYGNYGQLTYAPTGGAKDGMTVVDELATLLTAGRLNVNSRRILADAYDREKTKSGDDGALRLVQQLMVTTPEFHSTHNLAQMNGGQRVSRDVAIRLSQPQQQGRAAAANQEMRPYKAIIFLMARGGIDSYNMIIPHSQCRKDIYHEYKTVRGSFALSNETTRLTLNASSSFQICDNFFLHPDLPILKTLYDDEEALFFANTGLLPKPGITKETYKQEIEGRSGFFAHNVQEKHVQTLDYGGARGGTGLLGRITDVLSKDYDKNNTLSSSYYITDSIALESGSGMYALMGDASNNNQKRSIIHLQGGDGVATFNENPSSSEMLSTIKNLNQESSSSNNSSSTTGIFSETWSESLLNSLDENYRLGTLLSTNKLQASFPDTPLGQQLSIAARMIKARGQRQVERDAIYVELDMCDSHNKQNERLSERFVEMNDALESFVTELKDHQGVWDDAVVMEVSEFGRTLTPNGGSGSDHGWGGNYVAMGGSVKGGRILGQYPDDLTVEGPYLANRGRVIPTTGWEQIWNGVAEWFGIENEEDLDYVLPKRRMFDGLFGRGDLFREEPK